MSKLTTAAAHSITAAVGSADLSETDDPELLPCAADDVNPPPHAVGTVSPATALSSVAGAVEAVPTEGFLLLLLLPCARRC